MKIAELRPNPGSRQKEKRLGRGIGSGLGKTSGKGHKGQNARSGGGVRLGFEGGQMPLVRRVPKRGFTNNLRKVYTVINLEELNALKAGTVVTLKLLKEKGLVKKAEPYGLKVLGNGELKVALTIQCAKISEAAKNKVTKAGGKVEVI